MLLCQHPNKQAGGRENTVKAEVLPQNPKQSSTAVLAGCTLARFG